MDSKLTLSLNDESISRAKNYVKAAGTSLSMIVENFFDSLTVNMSSSKIAYGSLVNELSGIIQIEDNLDYKSDYTSYLEDKYE